MWNAVNCHPTDPAGRSGHSTQADKGTGSLRGPPDTLLQVHTASDRSASPLRWEKGEQNVLHELLGYEIRKCEWILKRHSMCVCVNMSLSTAKWKRELWNIALACCHRGCLFFHSFFFFTTLFFAQIMKNIIISGQKKCDETSNLCQRGGRNESNSNRNMAQPRLVSLLWDGIPLQIKNLEIYIRG